LLIETFDSSPSSLKSKNVISAKWWRQWCDFNNIAVQKPIDLVNEIVNEVMFKSIEIPQVEDSFHLDFGVEKTKDNSISISGVRNFLEDSNKSFVS